MNGARRTYALPHETLRRFELEIAPGKRSTKVAELVENWILEREREAIRKDIIEGCADMWDVRLEMAKEWEPLEEEVDRVLDWFILIHLRGVAKSRIVGYYGSVSDEAMQRVDAAFRIATGLTEL